MAKRKKWSTVIEEHGVRVRLFERRRGGVIYRDVVLGRTMSANGTARTKHSIKSLKTRDRDLAETRAKALAKRIAEMRLTDRVDGRLTLGELFAQYRRHRMPSLSASRAQAARTRMDLFARAWGRDLDVSDVDQTRVDLFVRQRRSAELVPARLQESVEEKGEKRSRRGYREPRPVRARTVDADLVWLSAAFNWARRHRVNGRRLLAENPLHDCTWPREKNPRRPVASHQRFTATMKHVDDVDPAGRLRCILALARWTGRRESAICGLRASDLLLSEDRIRAALAAEGMDERLAEHMPHGAIRWSAETDKEGLLFVNPISADARTELDTYLRSNPRMGDVALFPAPRDPDKPIRRDLAAKWLLRAERLAELPKLEGGTFHPYRRLWASERKHFSDADVCAAGGWKDSRALKQSYQQADPATVLRVVEGG